MARAGAGGSSNAACTNMAHASARGSIQEIRRRVTRINALKLNKLRSSQALKFGTGCARLCWGKEVSTNKGISILRMRRSGLVRGGIFLTLLLRCQQAWPQATQNPQVQHTSSTQQVPQTPETPQTTSTPQKDPGPGIRRGKVRHLPLQFAAAVLTVLLSTAGARWVSAQANPSGEYQVKAAFLFHLAQFVDWPPEAFKDGISPLTYCTIGEDPFGAALDASLNGKMLGARPLRVQHIKQTQEAQGCQVLFMGKRGEEVHRHGAREPQRESGAYGGRV
jgi:hypothetical protein